MRELKNLLLGLLLLGALVAACAVCAVVFDWSRDDLGAYFDLVFIAPLVIASAIMVALQRRKGR